LKSVLKNNINNGRNKEILKDFSKDIQKVTLAIKVNDEIYELNRPIQEDATIRFLSWEDKEGKMCFWHSSAHIMAEAIESFYPISRNRKQ